MPFPAIAVANEFLAIAKTQGITLTPMKLQKLVYFAHGWCLALTGQPLIRESVQAWQYGPVIPAIYHELKGVGNGPITGPANDLVMHGDGKIYFSAITLEDFPESEERKNAQEIIARVFTQYGKYSAAQLSNATHLEGTPWSQVYREGQRRVPIPNETIKTYFEGLASATPK
jgi:uncharacterized phage-associated protein